MLEKLCSIIGVSGSEERVRDFVSKEIAPYCDELYQDNIGNLIAFKSGEKRSSKKLMLCAHLDEIGFIATYIEENGLIRFDAVGGISDTVASGRRVVFENGVLGVIAPGAFHLSDKDKNDVAPKIEDSFIDIGASSKEETLKYISVGDTASFEREYRLSGDRVFAPALDDRIGVLSLINIIKKDIPFDTYFVFTVMEEVGLRGARVAANNICPDYAIVLEGTTAADIPSTPEHKKVCKIGGGATVSFMDRSTVYDKELYNLVLKTADEENIPCQVKSVVAGGNDSGAIHISGKGVKTAAVSVPCRYIHSGLSSCSLKDVKAQEDLAFALIKRIGSL